MILGASSFIGAGALVNKDVKAYALMVGVSDKKIDWMSEFREQLDLPLEGFGAAVCKHTGDACVLKNGYVYKGSKN